MRLGTYYRYLVIRELNLPLSGDKVLDIGCYDGFLLSRIDAKLKLGIDIKPVNKFPDVQYIQGDFLKQDFGEERFDRIFALDVLEHVKQDKEFVRRILHLLSPKGIAILSTPSKAIRVFFSFSQELVDKRWGHIYRRGYTRQEIKLMAGDKNISLIHWNCPLFRFSYLPLSLFWRISPSLTKVILYFTVKLDLRLRQGERGFLYLIASNDNQLPLNS
jgi:2-polyprenyl-3-methyl-5-hydroxy-6-metoxy-1,4-benzoquinol methylase